MLNSSPRGRWLSAFTLAFAVSATSAFGQEKRLTNAFPIDYSEEVVLRLIVRVTIGGIGYRFGVDTGASHTTFDYRLRRILRERAGSLRYLTAGGGRNQKMFAAPPAFIGSRSLPPLDEVVVDDLSTRFRSTHDNRIDGILGMDALRKLVFQIDFDRRRLVLLDGLPRDAGAPFELDAEAAVPTLLGIIAHLGASRFIVDTGFQGELAVSRDHFAALTASGNLSPGGTRPITTAAGLRNARWGILTSQFSIGGYNHRDVTLLEVPHNDHRLNVVGLDYLSRYIVTFDFPNNMMYLRPGASFNVLRPAAGLLGVRLERAGHDVIIKSVFPGSRAASFGLIAGDVLKTINGESTMVMSDAEIVRRLSGPNRKLSIKFLRVGDGQEPWMTIEDLPPR